MKLLLVFLLLLGSGCAHDPWTKEDTARHVGYTVLHVIDWRQTKEIAGDPEHYELNFVLGKYPTQKEVDVWFIGTWIGMTGAAYLLPKEWRKALHYCGISVEAACVGLNYSMSLNGEW